MAAGEEIALSVPSCLHMVCAFFAMEPPDVVISFAREFGGGYITESVQSYIWNHCISKANAMGLEHYAKKFLKKLIHEIESSGSLVLDELYEQLASYMISLKDDDAKEGNRVVKTISFLLPNDKSSGILTFQKSSNLEVQLQCSVNMLEGDTGCSIWPSSLFLSEFILSFPEIFSNKCCFEVGSGVGLVGICLAHVKASKVILSDGDFATLANMKVNLELNLLNTGNLISGSIVDHNKVHCVCLPWESASEDDLRRFAPDIILGADIIYDPSCLPHLVRVLAILLKRSEVGAPCELGASGGKQTSTCSPTDEVSCHSPVNGPVAYVASVIRNVDTFNYFLALAKEANLIVTHLTLKVQVSNFLPYLRSYQRSSIRIFRIHV